MRLVRPLRAPLLLATAAAGGCTGGSSEATRPIEAAAVTELATSPLAEARFATTDALFHWERPARADRSPARPAPSFQETAAARRVFAPSAARGYERVGEHLRATGDVGEHATFATTATGAFTVATARGQRLTVHLRGAREAAALSARGYLLYPGGAPGGEDLWFRTTPWGLEDFMTLRPESAAFVEYELALEDWTRGLRLVGDSLELLDAGGVPRLRLQTPHGVDRDGRVFPVGVSVPDCRVDRDPRAPFKRPVLDPGERRCTVRLDWDREALAFPALLDPGWMTTESMNTSRYAHVAADLPDGTVFVASGKTDVGTGYSITTSTAEIYSPEAGAWAATSPITHERAHAGTVQLANGDVFTTGGLRQTEEEAQVILDSTEVYSAALGTWSAGPSLRTIRAGHTATRLDDAGAVIVAGGYDNTGPAVLSSELLAGGAFQDAGDIHSERIYHAAVPLPGGRAMLLGGSDPEIAGPLATIEIYTLGTGWAAPATLNPMHKARTLLAASLLDDGDVLAVGGYNNADGMVLDSERYDLATGTWTLGTGHLRRGRNDATATLLLDGRVLVAGGADLQRSHADGEIYDPTTTSFEWVYGAANARTLGHTAHRLDGDRVLVVGGWYTEGLRILSECDIYDRDIDAGPPPPEEPDVDPDGGHARPDGGPRPRDAGADASGDPDGGGEPPPPLGPAGDGAYGATGGCRTALSGDDAWPLALLGALAWVARRRRSPRAPSDAMATRRPFR